MTGVQVALTATDTDYTIKSGMVKRTYTSIATVAMTTDQFSV